jgi:hypothetical protein
MSDIRMFVVHRNDLNSETMDNPLYYPMCYGTVYDLENLPSFVIQIKQN